MLLLEYFGIDVFKIEIDLEPIKKNNFGQYDLICSFRRSKNFVLTFNCVLSCEVMKALPYQLAKLKIIIL